MEEQEQQEVSQQQDLGRKEGNGVETEQQQQQIWSKVKDFLNNHRRPRLLAVLHKLRSSEDEEEKEEDDELKDSFTYALSLHNLGNGSWQQLPLIAEVECGIPLFSELVCTKGKLFVIGGRDEMTWQARKEAYMLDLAAGSAEWQHCQNMITARASFSSGVIDGKVYVAGGQSEVNSALLSTAEVYDPDLNVWEALQDMRGPRTCSSTAIWENSMYVIGGYSEYQNEEQDDPRDDDAEWANSAQVYDATTREWRQLIFEAGISDEQACTVFSEQLFSFSTLGVEKFDAATNSWKQVYEESWVIHVDVDSWENSSPCLVLSVAAVDNEVFALVCLGGDGDRGCTLLKTVGFGLPGPRLLWHTVKCPVTFVPPCPILCAVEV